MRNYDIITSLEKNGISIKDKKDIYLPSIYKKICEFCAILDYYVALYEFRNLNETPSGTSLPWSYELYRIKLCTAILPFILLSLPLFQLVFPFFA